MKKMKKKTKIILIVAIAAVVVIVAAVAIILATHSSTVDTLNSSAYVDLVEGTGEFSWKKYDVDIPINSSSSTRYYTNCSGDYISDLHYETTYGTKMFNKDYAEADIYFNTWHNVADDLWTIFILSDGSNVYRSQALISHLPFGCNLTIPFSNSFDENMRIIEIWVMTED